MDHIIPGIFVNHTILAHGFSFCIEKYKEQNCPFVASEIQERIKNK